MGNDKPIERKFGLVAEYPNREIEPNPRWRSEMRVMRPQYPLPNGTDSPDHFSAVIRVNYILIRPRMSAQRALNLEIDDVLLWFGFTVLEVYIQGSRTYYIFDCESRLPGLSIDDEIMMARLWEAIIVHIRQFVS